jgi:hypothetical protein
VVVQQHMTPPEHAFERHATIVANTRAARREVAQQIASTRDTVDWSYRLIARADRLLASLGAPAVTQNNDSAAAASAGLVP